MTRRQRQLSEQRWGTSFVRAPHASEGYDAESDVRVIRDDLAPGNVAPSHGFAYAGQNGEAAPAENGVALPGRAVALPTSPQDQEGMHQALLWVAWAVEECSRAYTRVSTRVADVERRLAALESAQQAGAAAPPQPAGSDVDACLEDMASKLESQRAEMLSRTDGLDRRLRELDFVPLKLSNVQRDLDKMRSGQVAASKAEAEAAAVPPPTARPSNPDVARLAKQLKETQRRLEALDKRLGVDVLTSAIVQAVQVETERVVGELTGDKADVEGVYRELDSIAEFVAGRFEAMERAGRRVDRLYEALQEAVRHEADEATPPATEPPESA